MVSNTNSKFENKASSTAKDYKDTLRQDVAALKSDAIELGRHLQESNTQVMEDVKDTVSKQFEKATAYGTEELKKAEKLIREKPAHAVAIAFVAGLVASVLFGRR